MRHHVSLVLTASFLFLSQGVQGSPINTDDDNSNGSQSAGVLQGASNASSVSTTSSDLQCYRRINGKLEPLFDDEGKLLDQRVQEPNFTTMTSVEKDGKLLWTNVLSSLAHHVRVSVMEYLQDHPRGQLSLMTVSHGFRRLALVLPQRYNDAVSTGNDLKKHLFIVLIGEQTGDLDLFMKDGQLKAFQTQSLQDLQDTSASRYYNGTLSPTTKHGKTYRSVGPGDIERGVRGESALSLGRKNLRLVPLNFPEALRIQSLDLSENQITAAPVVTGLTQLETLDLSNNQLKAAPDVSGLTKLELLDLSKNKLISAPMMAGLTKLERLELSKNKLITAPDVTGLTKLWRLNLKNNQITEAPDLTGLQNLIVLELSKNKLTTAPLLTGLPNLKELYLSRNRITAAPVVTGLSKLQILDLADNQLNAPPFVTGLNNLMRLILSNNRLSAAPVLTGLTALGSLYLDSNLCGDPTLLETLRALPKWRFFSFQVGLYAISKDGAGKEDKTLVSLD